MSSKSLPRCIFGLAAAIVVCLLATAGRAADAPRKEVAGQVSVIDFDDCDPVQMRAKIMGINPVNGAMIVGEKEIRLLDTHLGGKLIKTAFLDPEGKPESPAAFMVGHEILIKGMVHPEGFVAALVVQKAAAGAAAEGKKIRGKERKGKPARKSLRLKHHRRASSAPEGASFAR